MNQGPTQVPPHIPANSQNFPQRRTNDKHQPMQAQPHRLEGLHGVDEIRAKWKLQVASAKSAWDKLTEYELLKSEGHQQKLSDLVRGRYVISRHESDRQVKCFLNEHGS